MTWFYADGGRQMGPVEEGALDDLVRQGVVRDDTLVWREGMAAWQAHGVVRPRPAAPPPAPAPPAPPAPPPPPRYASPELQPTGTAPQPQYSAPPPPAAPGVEMKYCAECGRGFPAYELSMVGAASVCASCRPVVLQRMGPAAYMPPAAAVQVAARRYGGFWIRFLARVIDGFVLNAIASIIIIPVILLGVGGAALNLQNLSNPDDAAAVFAKLGGLFFILIPIALCINIVYEVYFLTSRGATPGKMALGLKVIRADGGPISAGLAVGRFFGQWLSGATLYIGYIIAGFDNEKRSLHDRLCETRVIYSK